MQAAKITAGQRPNPTASVTPTLDYTFTSPWALAFGLSVPIETADKRELRIQTAQKQAKSGEYKIIGAAWTVRNRLVNALIDYYAATESKALYQQQVALQKPIVDIFEQRLSTGQMLTPNASQTFITYRQTVLAEKNADKQQAEAFASIASAIGVSTEALRNIHIDTSTIAAIRKQDDMVSDVAREDILKHHSQLMAALADYQAAHSALQLEIAKQTPDINLGPGYEWSKDGSIYTLGLSVTLPVFNNNEGPIAEAEAKRQEAAKRFNALQVDVIGKIELAQASYKASRATLKTADQLVEAQKIKSGQLNSQLGTGEASKLPSLLAQSEITTAAIARLDAMVQLLKAKAALETALEQPLFGGTVDNSLTQSSPREAKP